MAVARTSGAECTDTWRPGLADALARGTSQKLVRVEVGNEDKGRGGIGRRACLRCMYPKGVEVQVLSTAPTQIGRSFGICGAPVPITFNESAIR